MNDKQRYKLNDRKNNLEREYKSGVDYFTETSMENYIDKENLFVNSMYNSFVNAINEDFTDETIENKNSPK